MILLALLAMAGQPAPASAEDTVKFLPNLKIHECPVTFSLQADCVIHEKELPVQQVSLGRETFGMKMASWEFRVETPVPAIARLLVLKTRRPDGVPAYSVAAEASLKEAPAPAGKARVEFLETTPPELISTMSQVAPAKGKKYLVELGIRNFHGNLPAKGDSKTDRSLFSRGN